MVILKMSFDKKKTDKSVLDDIDIDNVIKTANMDILPDYANEVIPKDDFKTIRKVIIETLPTFKEIDTKKFKGTRKFMQISDNNVIFQLAIDSKSLMRSLVALDVKMHVVKEKKELDLSRLIGKMVGIKRVEFTNKDGYINQCLNFFPLK